MKVRHHKDFSTGLLFILFGGAFAGGEFRHDLGTAAKMGPGYFPIIPRVLLALLGVFFLPGAARRGSCWASSWV